MIFFIGSNDYDTGSAKKSIKDIRGLNKHWNSYCNRNKYLESPCLLSYLNNANESDGQIAIHRTGDCGPALIAQHPVLRQIQTRYML